MIFYQQGVTKLPINHAIIFAPVELRKFCSAEMMNSLVKYDNATLVSGEKRRLSLSLIFSTQSFDRPCVVSMMGKHEYRDAVGMRSVPRE